MCRWRNPLNVCLYKYCINIYKSICLQIMLHQELPCNMYIWYVWQSRTYQTYFKHIYVYICIFTVNINIFAGKDSIIYKPIVSYSLLVSLNDLYCTISYLLLARYFAWNSKYQFFGSCKFGQGFYKAMPCTSICGIFTYTFGLVGTCFHYTWNMNKNVCIKEIYIYIYKSISINIWYM